MQNYVSLHALLQGIQCSKCAAIPCLVWYSSQTSLAFHKRASWSAVESMGRQPGWKMFVCPLYCGVQTRTMDLSRMDCLQVWWYWGLNLWFTSDFSSCATSQRGEVKWKGVCCSLGCAQKAPKGHSLIYLFEIRLILDFKSQLCTGLTLTYSYIHSIKSSAGD